jgi:hypothetical protein
MSPQLDHKRIFSLLVLDSVSTHYWIGLKEKDRCKLHSLHCQNQSKDLVYSYIQVAKTLIDFLWVSIHEVIKYLNLK